MPLTLKLKKRPSKWSNDPEEEVYVSSLWLYFLFKKTFQKRNIDKVLFPRLSNRLGKKKTGKRRKTPKRVACSYTPEYKKRSKAFSAFISKNREEHQKSRKLFYKYFPEYHDRIKNTYRIKAQKRHAQNSVMNREVIDIQMTGVAFYDPDEI